MLIFVCKYVAFTVPELEFYENQKWKYMDCASRNISISVPLIHWALTSWIIRGRKSTSY